MNDDESRLASEFLKNYINKYHPGPDTPIPWDEMGIEEQGNPVKINPLQDLFSPGVGGAYAGGDQQPKMDWNELLTRLLMFRYKDSNLAQ